jgi:hypothetical protein
VRLGDVGLLAPVRYYIEPLLHPSAQHDALTTARHRAFIAPRLLGSVVALAALPLHLIVRGAPSAIELIVFAWLVAPKSACRSIASSLARGNSSRIKRCPLCAVIRGRRSRSISRQGLIAPRAMIFG